MDKKITSARGKRKEAIARATVKPGTGRYAVNNTSVSSMSSVFLRYVYVEPLGFFPDASSKFDISVTVKGGGASGQAQASRTAVARALLHAHGDPDTVKQQMLSFDRSLLVEDPRRVEPKKFKGPKARARFTKSYR